MKKDYTIEQITYSLPVEAHISWNGFHFHIIYGKHEYGYYLVIPNFQIGCEMSYYNDRFWNRESLTQAGFEPTAAQMLSEAISKLVING